MSPVLHEAESTKFTMARPACELPPPGMWTKLYLAALAAALAVVPLRLSAQGLLGLRTLESCQFGSWDPNRNGFKKIDSNPGKNVFRMWDIWGVPHSEVWGPPHTDGFGPLESRVRD